MESRSLVWKIAATLQNRCKMQSNIESELQKRQALGATTRRQRGVPEKCMQCVSKTSNSEDCLAGRAEFLFQAWLLAGGTRGPTLPERSGRRLQERSPRDRRKRHFATCARRSTMLSCRCLQLNKACPVLARMLTSSTSGSQASQDIEGGHVPIHVNNVRRRLRDIVGASTNWRDHVQAMNERKALHTLLAKNQADLPPKKMKDSYIEVLLPLGSQPEIREKYLNVHNSVRFGRILEDLDSLGVLICYTHAKHEAAQRSPLSIVTALVDKIGLRKEVIHPDCDIKFTGNVSWVGRTSMEVKMHMLQLHDGIYSPVLDATFVMVARDPENKRAAYVNPLIPEGPEEEKIFQEGELNKSRRTDFSKASLLKMAPTSEERNIVHSIFLNTLDPRTISFRSRLLPSNSVWMEDAKFKGLEICHPQERNIFNRVFGGFLMRKAFELGWASAYSYGNSRPYVVAVDDIMFQKPVEVGSLLLLSSQVCYTERNYIQIRVHTEVYDPSTREHHTTNVFHFTFMLDKEIPQIVPKTYGESMLYLDGKRHFNSAMTENRTVP